MQKATFFKPLTKSATTLKILRKDAPLFDSPPFYAILYNNNTYNSIDDAYLDDIFELVKVTDIKLNADEVDGRYSELTIERAKGKTESHGFKGKADNYVIEYVDNLYKLNIVDRKVD